MTPPSMPASRSAARRLRAFTLVELMVAVTGGLFISIIVFAMARQGTRFYQQESRVAEATLAATIGMQRLRADIGRASYMSSAFIGADPSLCTALPTLSGVPMLFNMRSIQIQPETDPLITGNSDLQLGAATPIIPDQIILSGAYQSADRFITGEMPMAPGAGAANIPITLQPSIGALARYRYANLASTAAQAALLQSLFPIGRALRLVNAYGRVAYSIIAGTTPSGGPTGSLPEVDVSATPPIPLRGGGNNLCEFAGVGVEINVVNFIRYRIADVHHTPTYGSQFGQLYASDANPWDANRTELIREELDPMTGTPFNDPSVNPEIISEYAVDLKFEVTYGNPWPNPIQLLTTSPTTTNTVYTIAGTDTASRPERVRSVRVRLSVRSRDADRAGPIPGTGLYRLGITTNGVTTYARVRTLQADVAVPNHYGVNY
jgi:type II secretory pathway pseudopilin PulG